MVREGTVFAEVAIDVANITAATSLEVTATVKGARIGFPVIVWATALEANLLLGAAYCSAKDEVKFRIANPTAGDVNPASHSYFFVQF